MRVVVSAYACSPGSGSESGVGWNLVSELGRSHEVWAVTRANNAPGIEDELRRRPVPGLRFVYHDIAGLRKAKKLVPLGVPLYHYAWQMSLGSAIARQHRELRFDVAHQLTLGSYRYPSSLGRLGIPLVIGPVGGAEPLPRGFGRGFGLRGRVTEALREASNRAVGLDPFVRASYRTASMILAASPQMRDRFDGLGLAAKVRLVPQIAVRPDEIESRSESDRDAGDPGIVRGLFVGRLVHWKGAHIALEALARARHERPGLRLTILGRGPRDKATRALASKLALGDSVRFIRRLPSLEEVHRLYAAHDFFVFPSLHESGGMVVLEAMSAGLPVICFDWGGPGLSVSDETGIKIPPRGQDAAAREFAGAMLVLAADPARRRAMGRAGAARVAQHYSWRTRALEITRIYEEASAPPAPGIDAP